MIDSKYIIKDNGKYETQTYVSGRAIPEADGSSYRRREADFRTLSSSASDSAAAGQTNQKSDYEPLRLKFLRKY